ncbi:MAG: hypothetical protein J0I77_01800 [Rudaea sp.]|uniref:hypothetical protein n=1 Tax=unclassified Rudaea TaxID=2627037 RepID=UPI0010F9A2EA|nr:MULTISPECIES: hypothetical protein [unclassified Rudaea]MBN8884428.1 hypothetical protein [Rudaea sp.]
MGEHLTIRRQPRDIADQAARVPALKKWRKRFEEEHEDADAPLFALVADTMRPEPWVVSAGRVVGHALAVTQDEWLEALAGERHAVVFHSLTEVLASHPWADQATRKNYHATLDGAVQSSLRESEARAAETSALALDGLFSAAGAERCPKCGKPDHPGARCKRL